MHLSILLFVCGLVIKVQIDNSATHQRLEGTAVGVWKPSESSRVLSLAVLGRFLLLLLLFGSVHLLPNQA